jgi:hypothetical protein
MTRSRSLLLALVALAPPLAAQAQLTRSPATPFAPADRGDRDALAQDVFLTPVPVDVLDREIRARAPNSVADLFRAGLDVSGVGLTGTASSVASGRILWSPTGSVSTTRASRTR